MLLLDEVFDERHFAAEVYGTVNVIAFVSYAEIQHSLAPNLVVRLQINEFFAFGAQWK